MKTSKNLVGDIGATHARFGLVDSGANTPSDVLEFYCRDHKTLIPAMHEYLARYGNPALEQAVIAVGTPITGDLLRMTNNDWTFSQSDVKSALGLERLRFINDFTAQALSLPLLQPADLVQVGGGQIKVAATKAVLGPGTGLGVSGLVLGTDGEWTALEGEGGHVTVVAGSQREAAVVDWMSRKLTESHGHVSAERFLSGPGIEWIYQALNAVDQTGSPALLAAEISAAAIAGHDALAVETLSIFYRQLGAVAGDLALTLGATGGVYIAGGIVPRLIDHFACSGFRQAFEGKGRMSEFLAPIPTQVIVCKNPALLGATRLLS